MIWRSPPPRDLEITQLDQSNIISNTITTSSSNFFEEYKKNEQDILEHNVQSTEKEALKNKFKNESLTDEKCIKVFKERFVNTDVTLEELYKDCCNYFEQKDQLVYKARFLNHLTKCPVTNYPEKESLDHEKRVVVQKSPEQIQLLSNYQEYRTRLLADMDLKLIPPNTYVKSFDEWKSEMES